MNDSMRRGSKRSVLDFADELRPNSDLGRLQAQTRRHFLGSLTGGLGSMFLTTLASPLSLMASGVERATGRIATLALKPDPKNPLAPFPTEFAPQINRLLYLHISRHPSQFDMFDPPPAHPK